MLSPKRKVFTFRHVFYHVSIMYCIYHVCITQHSHFYVVKNWLVNVSSPVTAVHWLTNSFAEVLFLLIAKGKIVTSTNSFKKRRGGVRKGKNSWNVRKGKSKFCYYRIFMKMSSKIHINSAFGLQLLGHMFWNINMREEKSTTAGHIFQVWFLQKNL